MNFEQGKQPRYYQEIAINRAVQAIAKGQHRVLLTLATGTGKTFIISPIFNSLPNQHKKFFTAYLTNMPNTGSTN